MRRSKVPIALPEFARPYRTLTGPEIQELLRVDRGTVRRWANRKEHPLPIYKMGTGPKAQIRGQLDKIVWWLENHFQKKPKDSRNAAQQAS